MGAFSIKTEMNGDVTVVTASGRIDSETATSLDAELAKVASANKKIVVDLKGVEYMSSAGLRAVVKAAQVAEKKGGAVKLASVPELVNSVMYTVGLDQRIGSFANVGDAVASF